jgi:hypothetical protein
MKKTFASAIILAAIFFTAQVFGQDYQTKGSGESSKKMNSKTTTTAKPSATEDTKTAKTQTQSEVSPAVKPPDGQKQETKTTTQGSEQKPGTSSGSSKTGTGTTTVTSGSGKTQTQTGGTMTTANAAQQSGKIYDAQGNLFATVDNDGWIRDPKNRLMGQYTQSGEYYTKNRVKAASVQNGTIRDMNGKDFGKIGQDGKVFDSAGKLLGTIAADGTITDAQGKKIGSAQGVDKNVAAMIFFYQASGSSVKSGKR